MAKTQLCGAMRQDPPRPSGHSHPLGSGSHPGPPPQCCIPGEDKLSGADARDGGHLHHPESGPTPMALMSLKRPAHAGGSYHRPPTPARAPHGLVSNGHSPQACVSGPTAAGRSLGGPDPRQVHAHVEQLSPKAQESRGRPWAGGPPPQGHPRPQLRAGCRGTVCPRARGPQRTHLQLLLPPLLGHVRAHQPPSS